MSLLACGSAPDARAPEKPRASEAEQLAAAERPLLASLAIVDARLERRVREHASEAGLRKIAMDLILSEDTEAAVIEGRIDPFSFDARERALAKLTVPALDPREPAPKLERELLARLIDAERTRVTLERELPTSGSDLVRAVVETWRPAADDATRKARDAWLARRLSELESAVSRSPLPREEQYELEDALDPLEQALEGYKDATAALIKLRLALSAQAPAPPAPWSSLSRELEPHVGPVPAPAALVARFEALERALRPASQPDDFAQLQVKKVLLDGEPPCALEGQGSLVRALGAPPERELACRLVRAVASGDAKLAMHRVLALALAAVSARAGVRRDPPPGVLQGIPALGVRAAGRPAPFIVAALAIEHLLASPDPAARARAWLAFGEAPLDVIAREVR